MDSVPTHGISAEILDIEQLEKWSILYSVREQLRSLPNGVEKPSQYIIPDTRWAYIDYSVDVKPGIFGHLVPGKEWEYNFQPVGKTAMVNSDLFSYSTEHWVNDRDDATFEVVNEKPMM